MSSSGECKSLALKSREIFFQSIFEATVRVLRVWLFNYQVVYPRYVRINTLQLSVEKAVEQFVSEGYELVGPSEELASKFQFKKDIHIPDLLVFPPSVY